ncbi:acetyltransferase [Melampsora larici-populina 98AG31]|uniref:Acetyltransferase n=1 Tax=Melampsora larici-populina (strain 98AG31 / pathotype 3-4-7) TaxID=747676 RepID=F4S6M3_MELLP|nr:acetyltransferase [Melampsora larici-populina 98AG31]EGF99715.1 acetyltransferase [Melampsora larici-populina 98AG31]
MWETMAWTNGLQGLITILILFDHSSLAFHPWESDLDCLGRPTSLMWQSPLIQTLLSSRFLLYLYFTLSGYILSVRHFSSIHLNHQSKSQSIQEILKTFIHRNLYLIIIVSISTYLDFCCWLLGVFNSIDLGEMGTNWSRDVTFQYERIFYKKVSLETVQNFVYVWFDHGTLSNYKTPHWTLFSEFYGLISICIFTIITISMKTWKRQFLGYMIVIVMYSKSLIGPASFLIGTLISDLHTYQIFSRTTTIENNKLKGIYLNIASLYLTLLTCFLISFPHSQSSSNPILQKIYVSIKHWFEENPSDFQDFFNSLGSSMMILSILISKDSRKFLSHSTLCFFGDLSLSLYFIHIPILIGIGTMVYKSGLQLSIPIQLLWLIVHPIWFSCAFWLSWMITLMTYEFLNFLDQFDLTSWWKSLLNFKNSWHVQVNEDQLIFNQFETIHVLVHNGYSEKQYSRVD